MTKVDAQTAGDMEATATGFTSKDPSLNIELKHQHIANLKPGLAISVLGGVMLVLATEQSFAPELVWGWLGGLSLCNLVLWLWLNQQHREIIVTASAVICALFWGLASTLFITPNPLNSALLAAAIIIGLTTVWTPLHIQTALFRHLFLLSVYIPLALSLCIHYRPYSAIFIVALTAIYMALNNACRSSRQAFIETVRSAKRADDNSQQIVTTSKKITSLIEQTPLGFIEWNQHREIIG